jgi:hypothetical protein
MSFHLDLGNKWHDKLMQRKQACVDAPPPTASPSQKNLHETTGREKFMKHGKTFITDDE